MSENAWVTEAIEQALLTVPLDDLIDGAADHVKVKGEWNKGLIRPSLVADPCRLSRVKKYLGHVPNPTTTLNTIRAGRPSAGTAVNFARGYFMEGFLVTAMKAVMSDAIKGCSPGLLFRSEDLEAHPDLMAEVDGLELVQMKCPSVFAFDRAEKNQMSSMERYLPQMATEMYIGRKQGYDIKRSHLLMATFEGWLPSSGRDGLRTVLMTIEHEPELDGLVEEAIAQIREDVKQAEAGDYPKPYDIAQATKYPCSYCNYSRLGDGEAPACA